MTGSVRGTHSASSALTSTGIPAERVAPAHLRGEHVRVAGRDHRDPTERAHQARSRRQGRRGIPEQIAVRGLGHERPLADGEPWFPAHAVQAAAMASVLAEAPHLPPVA